MATVLHLTLSHDKSWHRIQKVQKDLYGGQMVQSSHVHKHIHAHGHGQHGVHRQVHIQNREQEALEDEGDVQDAHIHVHNLKYDKKKVNSSNLLHKFVPLTGPC